MLLSISVCLDIKLSYTKITQLCHSIRVDAELHCCGQQPQFRGGENEIFKPYYPLTRIYSSQPKRPCLHSRGLQPIYHCSVTTLLVGRRRKLFASFIYPLYAEYIIITAQAVLALERAVTDYFSHCPITSPTHLGGGENFLSPIRSRCNPCLLSAG